MYRDIAIKPEWDLDFCELTYAGGVPGCDIEDLTYEWDWEWIALWGSCDA